MKCIPIDGEQSFTLLGRDACASYAIRQWCEERVATGKNKRTDHQIVEALSIADAMDKQREAVRALL